MSSLINSLVANNSYSYILSSDLKVVYYTGNTNVSVSIDELEFGSNKNEAEVFNSAILPEFLKNNSFRGNFTKNDEKYLIVISPILVKNGFDNSLIHWGSIATCTKEKVITFQITQLRETTKQIFIIEGVVFSIFMLGLIYFFWYLISNLAKSIVAPLNELYHLLKRLIRQDFAIDLAEKISEMSRDLIKLYKAFDKLRLVLKFKDEKYFTNPTTAIINYSQAIQLFRRFRNEPKVHMCLREIGIINIKNNRIHEGVGYLHESLKNYSGPYIESLPLKVFTAKHLIIASYKSQEAHELFEEVINQYTLIQDPTNLAYTVLEYIEALIFIGNYPFDLINQAKTLVQTIKDPYDFAIISQKICLYDGMIYQTKGFLEQAGNSYLQALTEYEYYDPEVRKNCAKYLSIFGVNLSVFSDNFTDFSLVVQSKYLEFSKFLLNELSAHVTKNDRTAFIVYSDKVKSLQNMTNCFKFYYRPFGTEDKGMLFDAICRGFMYLQSQSFDSQRNKWVVVLTDGVEDSSFSSFEEVCKAIKKTSAGLVVLLFGKKTDIITELVNTAERGIIYDCRNISNDSDIWQEIAAFLLPSAFLFKQKNKL